MAVKASRSRSRIERIESKSGERVHALAKDEDDQVAEDQLGPVALQTYSKAEIAAGYERLYGK